MTEMAGSVNYASLRPPCARVPATRVGETLDQSIVSSKALQPRVLLGPVAILWDIENCPVPVEVNAEDVAGNIRMALRVHPAVKGAVTMFSAYGDFNHFPRRLREGCQRTGVNLIDVPNGKKDASDKAILVDMFLFALDNPPPCTILLISGDVDFAPALHKLGQRGYTVVLAIPAGVGVSSALCNAGRFVWDWPSVARGEGFVPAKSFLACAGEERLADFGGYSMGAAWLSSDDSDLPTEDECQTCRRCVVGTSHLFSCSGDSMKMSVSALPIDSGGVTVGQDPTEVCGLGVPDIQNFPQCVNGPAKAQGLVQGARSFSPAQSFGLCQFSQTSASVVTRGPCAKPLPIPTSSYSYSFQKQNDYNINVEGASVGRWVHPGDIQGLKAQLTKLLRLNGGKLNLVRIPSEYCKLFGRPLYLSEYGSPKLVHLLERMPDAFFIKGEGSKRTLHLRDVMQTPRQRRARASNCLAAKEGRSTDKIEAHQCSENSERLEQIAEDADDFMEDLVIVQDAEACSDDERTIDQHETRDEYIQDHEVLQFENVAEDAGDAQDYGAEVKLEVFRQELQDLLVSHACKIMLASFLTLYRQRYSRDLDISSFGVEELELLIERVNDVAIVKEEQGTRRKFLVAKHSAVGDYQ